MNQRSALSSLAVIMKSETRLVFDEEVGILNFCLFNFSRTPLIR